MLFTVLDVINVVTVCRTSQCCPRQRPRMQLACSNDTYHHQDSPIEQQLLQQMAGLSFGVQTSAGHSHGGRSHLPLHAASKDSISVASAHHHSK